MLTLVACLRGDHR